MKEQFFKKEITEREWELIVAIRNYKLAFPRGQRELEFYAQRQFDELMDLDLDF